MMFKMAAIRIAPAASIVERALLLFQDPLFLCTMTTYLALSLIWVWILTFIPISRAYPFLALAIACTPIVGGLIFNEPITLRLVIGLLIIVVGLFVITGI